MLKKISVLIAMVILLPFVPEAQEKGVTKIVSSGSSSTGTTRAIIVGISNYKNIQKLTYAHTDALQFYRYLISPAGGSVDSNNIMLLLNEKATAARIYSALDALIDISKEGDEVIFYFSGHGDLETKTIRQNGFLLGFDAPQAAYMSGGTIGLNYLQDYLVTLAQKNKCKVILITDACRSGKLAGGMDGVKMTASALQEQWQSITKILSSQAGELSYEDKKWGPGGGVFTFYLLRGIKGLADMNNDGKVTVSELFIYLSQNIPRETKFVQNPYIAGDLASVISYVDTATVAQMRREEASGGGAGGQLAFKGFDDKITEGLDSAILRAYNNFQECIRRDILVDPDSNMGCAWDIYENLKTNDRADQVINNMKRSLLAALQDKAQTVINLYVEGKEIPDSLNIDQGYKELEYALKVIDSNYILYNHIKARFLFLKGGVYEPDYNERLKIVEEGLKLEPDAAFGWFLIGSAYYNLKNYDESYKAYMKTLELAPRWAYPMNNIGTLYDAQNMSDSAMKYYYKAIEFKKDMPEPYYNIGLTFYDHKDYKKAEEYQDMCLTYKPDYGKAWNNKGWIYYDQENYQKALEFFKKAEETDDYNADFKTNVGAAYDKLKDYDNAIKSIKAALKIDGNKKSALYHLGLVYENKKDFNSALYYYDRAIRGDTSYNFLLASIGSIYVYDLQEYDKGISYYQRYTDYRPESPIGPLNIGNAYYTMDKYTEALKYYEGIYKKDPTYKKAWLYAGQCHYMLDNQREALKMFNKALSIDSAYGDAYIEIARIYKKNKDYNSARDMYLLAIEKDTAAGKVYYKLGDLYCYDLGYYPNAIEAYKKYIAKFPDDKDVMIDLGNAYYYNLEYTEAMDAYIKYRRYDPDYKGIYLDIANCNAALNDTAAAIKNYLKAVDLDSAYSKAWKAMADLQAASGLYTEAISGYMNAMKFDSSYNYLNYTIGQVYMNNLKDYSNSEKYFKTYIGLYPSAYYGYQGMGYTCLKSGKNKKALEYFNTALQKDPAEPWNYYNLACFYALTGDKENSVTNLRLAFEKGFENLEHAKTDSDLESIRSMPEYDAIIKKYTKD